MLNRCFIDIKFVIFKHINYDFKGFGYQFLINVIDFHNYVQNFQEIVELMNPWTLSIQKRISYS